MRPYLICIDSDGCAIDSMEIKHRRCFGPCLVDVWQLEAWREPILDRWNAINLYESTRGINRFLGLEKILTEIDSKYTSIEGLVTYQQWCKQTKEFSQAALPTQGLIFDRVRQWSQRVNECIVKIAPQIQPFPGVKQALAHLSSFADLAVVTSANQAAVEEEWKKFGLLDYVKELLAQESGTKTDAICRLLTQGYAPEKTVMIGDAKGDEAAANANGVGYYPIIPGREKEIWQALTTIDPHQLFPS